MNCHTVQLNLIPFIEGGLGAEEAQSVQAHLAWCPACAEEKARLESVVGPLTRIGGVEIDERRFMAMVREKAAYQRKKVRRLAGLALGFAACLVVAGGAVGVVALYRTSAPVLPQGGRWAWDGRTAQAPSVIWNADEQLYQMWYDGRGHGSSLAAIGYATSKDGAVWTKYNGNPVIPADARWPSVLYEPEGTLAPYKIWFNVGRGVAIRHARSLDGIRWTDVQTVLTRGRAGTYDDSDVAAPRVVKVNDEYWMYYSAGTSTIRFPHSQWGHFVALATSPDGVHWTKRQTVLSRGAPHEWDGVRIFNPAVIHADGLFEMWYVGGDGTAQIPARTIGYASSSDGVNWTKSRRNPVIVGSDDSAYDYAVTAPGVLKVEDGYKVWFTSLTKYHFIISDVQVGYAEYPLDAWAEDGGSATAAAPPEYTYAEAWAMSEQERMRVLVPGPQEPLPKTITIGGEGATFYAYAAPGDTDWKMVWEPPGGPVGHSLRGELKMLQPGPGLTILYGQPQGDKVFVFGTVTASVPWGDQRTFTMREDAFNKSSPEPLHLNPQAPQ